jgi:hypothetical protein
MVGKIFLSYRRDDWESAAGGLYDRLVQVFGENQLFMDFDSLDPGLDSVKFLRDQVASCQVLLAVIGKDWVTATDSAGVRRLTNPDDWVRIEIEVALKLNIRVIPVLVNGASMPRPEQLPEGLKSLARRQAIEVTHTRFGRDVEHLAQVLKWVLAAPESPSGRGNEPISPIEVTLPSAAHRTSPDSQYLFISYVREDRVQADELVRELEGRGVTCWIAPRNVRPGQPYDDQISDAIERCTVLVLLFSERCNNSEYIRREITFAHECQKLVVPFRIEEAQPQRGLRLRLLDLHWIDGFVDRKLAVDALLRAAGLGNEPQ